VVKGLKELSHIFLVGFATYKISFKLKET